MREFAAGDGIGCLFFALYATAFAYSLHAFIGWHNAVEDCLGPSLRRLLVPPTAWLARHAVRFAAFSSVGVPVLGFVIWSAILSPEPPVPPVREAAVTFDDLPFVSVTLLDAEAKKELTGKLLAAAASHNVPVVGFVNEYGLYGFERQPRGAPDTQGVALLEMWLDKGFDLGNHTFAHTDLHLSSRDDFKQDIIRGEEVTRRLLQRKGLHRRYFRHPYPHTGRTLETRHDLERFLANRGYRVAPVTVDNEDWLFAAAYSKSAERGETEMMRRVGAAYLRYTEQAFAYSEKLSTKLFGREIRQIVLLHANALNADYFGEIAERMKWRGYSFITIDKALQDKAYDSADTYTGGETLNWLARWSVASGLRTAENVLDEFPDVPAFVREVAGIKE